MIKQRKVAGLFSFRFISSLIGESVLKLGWSGRQLGNFEEFPCSFLWFSEFGHKFSSFSYIALFSLD